MLFESSFPDRQPGIQDPVVLRAAALAREGDALQMFLSGDPQPVPGSAVPLRFWIHKALGAKIVFWDKRAN